MNTGEGRNVYWLPAIDLRDCAKAELYSQSGDNIATLSSAEWSDEMSVTLQYQKLHILDNSASFTATINNPNNKDVTGQLIAVAYSGGKQIGCTVIPDVTVIPDGDTEKHMSVDWQEKATDVELKLFFLSDSWRPLTSSIAISAN